MTRFDKRLAALALLACLISLGCKPREGRRIAEPQWGAAVSGLQLSLTRAERGPQDSSAYTLSMRNNGSHRIRIVLGHDVHGEPSLSHAFILRITDSEGVSTFGNAHDLGYIGAFNVCLVPLPPGASYTMPLRLDPDGFLIRASDYPDGSAGPSEMRTFRMQLEYIAGIQESLDHKGARKMHRKPVLSNELTLTGDFALLGHTIYRENEPGVSTLEDVLGDGFDLWKQIGEE